ncbi:hypothetical protein BH23GEM9_BH23GEM9_05520 [soil metagenome]
MASAVRIPLLIALASVGGAAVLSYGVPLGAPTGVAMASAVLFAAPLAALGLCVFAALSVNGGRSGPWLVFCSAAAFAVLGQLHRHTGVAAELETVHIASNVAAAALFAVGAAWLLKQRTSGRTLEVALDASLLLTAAVVAALHWSGTAWPLEHSSATSVADWVMALGGLLAAGAAFVGGSVLVTARAESGQKTVPAAGPDAIPLGLGGAALGISILPVVLNAGSPGQASLCCTPSAVAGLAFVFGWLAVGYAGLQSAQLGAQGTQRAGNITADSRLRLLVAPSAAMMMGTVAIDSAVNSPIGRVAAASLGAMGILVALRLGHLLFLTRSQTAVKLELAQSLALIEVSHALSSTRQLEETLALVSRWAVRLLDGKAAVIELLMPDGETLELHAVHGLPTDMLGLTFPVEGSFTGWVVRHGRPRCTDNAALDPFLHAASVPYVGGSALASVPLRYSNTTLGALSCIGRRPFTTADIAMLGAFADQAAVAIENARLFRQVHLLSITDPLTGLANRRQLERDLAREFAAARRGRRLIAVMFDLNEFKAYNDQYGHPAGDEALRLFAATLSALMRTMNVAARYGGDEFIVLLADTDTAGAEVFIERVHAGFPGADARGRLSQLSVAAGYAEFSSTMRNPDELVAAADAALYLNKSPGSRS